MESKEKEKQKQRAAKAAAAYIRDNMILGLGTGSTAYYLIQEAGALVKAGMQLQAVVTSKATEELAGAWNIPVILPEDTEYIDLAIDGVDEIDSEFCAVKGGGGALLREKIIASKAAEVIWIMDESKQVNQLGAFPLPVEVLPFGHLWVKEAIQRLGWKAVQRYRDGHPFYTDNGNAVLDVSCINDMDYRKAADIIKGIPGVLETGYFEGICSRIIIGGKRGVREVVNPDRKKGGLYTEGINRYTHGYIGTYLSEESRGIYHFIFNEGSGEMTEPELFYKADNAKWVSLSGDSLVFPIEKDGRAGTCFLRLEDGKVKHADEILEERTTPCYILQEGEFVFTANYHEGTVMAYSLKDKTPCVIARIENGEEAGCHQIILHGQYMMVPCLEQDKIRVFDINNGFQLSGEIDFPEGSGPRHGVFNKAHTKLFVVSERSNELFIFGVLGREFNLEQTLPISLEYGEKAAAAAIRLSGDERFLYISVRGQDILTVVDVSGDEAVVIQQVPCGGEHPRDLILSRGEGFIITANRFGGGVVSMARDKETGMIGEVRSRITMKETVSLRLA